VVLLHKEIHGRAGRGACGLHNCPRPSGGVCSRWRAVGCSSEGRRLPPERSRR